MARRKTKKTKRRILVFGTISIVAIFYFVFNLCLYSYKIAVLKKSKVTLEQQLSSLQQNEEKLSTDIQKLKDPEYIARYARETYMYSKDGEYIIKIDDNKNIEEEQKEPIDYKYLIIISSLSLLIIILYIIKKTNKKK